MGVRRCNRTGLACGERRARTVFLPGWIMGTGGGGRVIGARRPRLETFVASYTRMPTTAENYSLGLPVEIGKIDKELKKLWEQSAGAMTRASLVNLAVYSEAPGSLTENTKLISQITLNHACRAIVIGADTKAKQN